MPCGSLVGQALPLAMIVPWDQPNGSEQLERHSLTVIGNGDCRLSARRNVQAHHNFVGIRIVRVLDQFKDCESGTTDQLITE